MSTRTWTRTEAGHYVSFPWEIHRNPERSVNEYAWLLYHHDESHGPIGFDTLAEAKTWPDEEA